MADFYSEYKGPAWFVDFTFTWDGRDWHRYAIFYCEKDRIDVLLRKQFGNAFEVLHILPWDMKCERPDDFQHWRDSDAKN